MANAKVDEMQGVTSAGDITITGEGGTGTQQLQQGQCKAWLQGNSDASTDDSLKTYGHVTTEPVTTLIVSAD